MSGIVINIRAGRTVEESSVTATGKQIHVIADSERATFGIGSDADLKRAVGKHFGKEPYYAYVKSPTPPCGDLYKEHGWSQVQRVLKPIKAEILGIKTKPRVLSMNTLNNKSKKTAAFSTKISEQVTDTVSSEWSNSSKISAELAISFDIIFVGIDAKLGFEQTWGKSDTITKQVTTGMEAGVTVDLKPGEAAIVELCASSGKMQVRITYEAYLIGSIAAYYYYYYKGQYYWNLPVSRVLGSKKVLIVQDIEVSYYSNASAEVKNAITNEEMVFYIADHPSEHLSDDHPDERPPATHPDELASADNPDEHPTEDHSGEPASE